MTEKHGLECVTRNFTTRQKRNIRGKWTFRQRQKDGQGIQRWRQLKVNFWMMRPQDRQCVTKCRWVIPPTHNSYHRALIGRLQAGNTAGIRRYQHQIKMMPLRLAKMGPRTKGESLFDQLAGECMPLPTRDRPANRWIRSGAWAFIDQRAVLRHQGQLTTRLRQRLGQKIKAGLKADRVKRARKVGEEAMRKLGNGDAKGAWNLLGG